MSDNWQEQITSYLKADKSFIEYRTILLKVKVEGMSAQDALRTFEDIRNKLKDEKDEDRLLEVMDIIAGYCSPHLNVW